MGRGGGGKYEAGLKKRGDVLSAFLLAAKLRIDVSRSIQRLAARRAARLTPFVKKKKKKEKMVHRWVPENSNRIAESMQYSRRKLIRGRREARATTSRRGVRFLAV